LVVDKTILILDDEPDLRDLLAEILHDNTILTASSGNEALSLLAGENVDLMILDNKLHGETGLEILENVTAIYPDLAILPISGNMNDADKEKYREAGIEVFLEKPFDMDQVKNAILQAIGV
jgi:CheY-like chemotaxis protein